MTKHITKKRILKKAVFITILSVVCLLFSQSVLAGEYANTTGSATISTDTTVTGEKWVKGGNLTIETGATLQINADSSLTFEPGYHITIQSGAYIIKSAANATIVKAEVPCECGQGSDCAAGYYCQESDCSCQSVPVCQVRVEAGYGTTNVTNNTQAAGCNSTCQACQSGVCGVANVDTDPGSQCGTTGCYTGNCQGGTAVCGYYTSGQQNCADCNACNASGNCAAIANGTCCSPGNHGVCTDGVCYGWQTEIVSDCEGYSAICNSMCYNAGYDSCEEVFLTYRCYAGLGGCGEPGCCDANYLQGNQDVNVACSYDWYFGDLCLAPGPACQDKYAYETMGQDVFCMHCWCYICP